MGWLSKLFGSDGGGRSAKPENFEQWFEQYAALGLSASSSLPKKPPMPAKPKSIWAAAGCVLPTAANTTCS